MNTEMTVNGVLTSKVVSDAGSTIDYADGSNVAIKQLFQDDHVEIRSATSALHSGSVAGRMYSSFAGWRLLF